MSIPSLKVIDDPSGQPDKQSLIFDQATTRSEYKTAGPPSTELSSHKSQGVRISTEYKPSGKTTPIAVIRMAAAMLPAAVVGALFFAVVIFVGWAIGCWVSDRVAPLAGFLSDRAGFFLDSAGEAWRCPNYFRGRTIVMLAALLLWLTLSLLSLIAFLIHWAIYLVAPLLAICAPAGLGVAVGDLTARAGVGGKNRNVVVPATLAVLTTLAADFVCTAMIFPNLPNLVFGAENALSGWDFFRLEVLTFRSPVIAWLIAGIGLVVGVMGAIDAAAQMVRQSPFCEDCNVCFEEVNSPKIPDDQSTQIFEIFDARDFGRLEHIKIECIQPNEGTGATVYYLLTLETCPVCGTGFLVATGYSNNGSHSSKLRSITVSGNDATIVKAALGKFAARVP